MNVEDKLIEPRAAERRHERRQRVLKGALIVFGNHDRAFDCVVRNLSNEGAKLTLESTNGIPDRFELLIPTEKSIAPAQTIWRTNRELGIAFTGPWRPNVRRG